MDERAAVAAHGDGDMTQVPFPPLRHLVPRGRPARRALMSTGLVVAGLVGLTLDAIGPTASPALIAGLLATAALVVARRRPVVAIGSAAAVVAVAILAVVMDAADVGPAVPATSLFGGLLGWLTVTVGVVLLVVALVRRRPGRAEVALGVVGVGVVGVVAPEQALFLAQQLAAIGLLATAAMVLIAGDGEGSPSLAERFLRDDERSWDDRATLVAQLSFEGEDAGTRVARFLALMGFASVLASLGVVVDSTAIVIGAMLVAPLMTPLMATALSLAVGWPRRATRGVLVAAAGILLSVSVGALVGAAVPVRLVLDTNPQVLSRTEPSLIDFAVALAAGGAGGFALARKDVSDALPGVAVAISLVPPLTVVGLLSSRVTSSPPVAPPCCS